MYYPGTTCPAWEYVSPQELVKWQCFCRSFDVALGDVSGGTLGSCALGYGSVRLVSVGHYLAVSMQLATGIPATDYAGMKEEERMSRLVRVRTFRVTS